MTEQSEYYRELWNTQRRLAARLKGKRVPVYGPEAPMEEVVTLLAQVLGAKDPYLAVLYPDDLQAVLDNTHSYPETGYGLIPIEGTP